MRIYTRILKPRGYSTEIKIVSIINGLVTWHWVNYPKLRYSTIRYEIINGIPQAYFKLNRGDIDDLGSQVFLKPELNK